MRTQTKSNQTAQGRENARDQLMMRFSFDWLRKWHEFCGPIIE